MNKPFQLNDITSQIQNYVRQIKQRKTEGTFRVEKEELSQINNDLKSNINKLNGSNKFKIQNMMETEHSSASSNYAAEAYNHLSDQDNKHKVVIDFMHKNNRNYDMKV